MSRGPGSIRRRALATLGVVALLALGCSSGSSSGPPTTGSGAAPSAAPTTGTAAPDASVAPEGFTSVTVLITRPDGTVEEHCMWLADTGALRQLGLMGVTDPELGGRDGMVFVFPDDLSSGFWMKDTLLPLSIAWFAADGDLVGTADMEPCPPDAERCPTYGPGGPYRYAVEVPMGGLDELGVEPGTTLALGSACGETDVTT